VFSYTPSGQVKEAVSPGGIKTSYRYDDKTGHVLEVAVTSADGKTEEKTGYSYDPHTGAVTAVFDPDDKAGTLIGYAYDADGNTTEVAYPDGKTVRQEYADNGLLAKSTDTAGLTTFYTYHPDGTLKEAVQHERDDTASPVKAKVAYTYDGLGRIIKTDRGNGVVTETEFTGASQIRHEKTTRDGHLVTEAAYTYDSHGSLTQRTDTRPQAGPGGAPGEPVSTTTRYTYDAYNRLTGSEILGAGGEKLTTSRYELNVSGDVVKTEVTGHTGDQAGKTEVTGHGIDSSGRLTTLTVNGEQRQQAFDTDGHLTTAHDGTTWTYNLNGRPATSTAPDGTLTRYTYWADGTRATTTETTGSPGTAHGNTSGGGTGSTTTAPQEHTTRFYYTPDGTILNDTHTTGTDKEGGQAATTASYLLAGTRQARTLTGQGADTASPTGAGYLIQDRHGNTTALTTSDGQVSQAWQYTDYGQHTSPDSLPQTPGSTAGTAPAGPAGAARNPFTYAGEYTSPDGTQYLKTRLYDTSTGRFTTPDPAPQHNRYQAFGANPVTNIDPEGTTEIPDWGSWLIWGITFAAALITTAITVATAGSGTLIAVGVAAAALDVASGMLDAVAMGTGRTQIDDPLNVASLTLGAAGLALGIGQGALIARAAKTARAPEAADEALEVSVHASPSTSEWAAYSEAVPRESAQKMKAIFRAYTGAKPRYEAAVKAAGAYLQSSPESHSKQAIGQLRTNWEDAQASAKAALRKFRKEVSQGHAYITNDGQSALKEFSKNKSNALSGLARRVEEAGGTGVSLDASLHDYLSVLKADLVIGDNQIMSSLDLSGVVSPYQLPPGW
ncbi:RHS repeat-associated core domain-containing protein, partial [Streptomyces sp. NPDC008121]|uniref:RHS repeat-associated core domain-containing protein n=1 Tax=Streptomyces sp. NPDC008121 TaxID=3364809 RepID=UPI0036E27660